MTPKKSSTPIITLATERVCGVRDSKKAVYTNWEKNIAPKCIGVRDSKKKPSTPMLFATLLIALMVFVTPKKPSTPIMCRNFAETIEVFVTPKKPSTPMFVSRKRYSKGVRDSKKAVYTNIFFILN